MARRYGFEEALTRRGIDPDFYDLHCAADRVERAVFKVRKLEDEEMQHLHQAKEVRNQLRLLFEST